MQYIAVFRAIFLRLFFHSFEYPYPIIFTLKIYHSVALKVAQLFPVSNLFPSGLWLKSVSDFTNPKYFEVFSVKGICEQILTRRKVTAFSSKYNITNLLSKLKTLSSDFVCQVEHFLYYAITLKRVKIAIVVKLCI